MEKDKGPGSGNTDRLFLMGSGYRPSAGAASDLPSVVPFSAQALWLMKQTRSLLETYHVDGDKPADEKKMLYGAVRNPAGVG